MYNIDLSEFYVTNVDNFALLRSKETDFSKTSLGDLTRDSSPADLVDKVAFDKMFDLFERSKTDGCFWNKLYIHNSTDYLELRVPRNVFYRNVNALIGPSEESKEAAKKHWYKFNKNLLEFLRLKKKAFGKNGKTLSKPTENQLDPSRFSHFRPYHEFIINMFGKMFTAKEIKDLLGEEHGLRLTLGILKSFHKFHADLIAKRISAFKESFEDVRLGYKRSRLEELAWIYQQVKNDFKNPKLGIARRNSFSKEMRDILKQIKDEVEGDVIRIEGSLDVNHHLQAHIVNEIIDRETLRTVVIAKIASKLNLEPLSLTYEMQKSHYALFNSYLGNDPHAEGLELPDHTFSPADYDFKGMGKKAENQLRLLNKKNDGVKDQRKALIEKMKLMGAKKLLKDKVDMAREVLEEEKNKDFQND